MTLKAFKANNKVIWYNINKADKMIIDLFKSKKPKNIRSKIQTYVRAAKKLMFLIFSAKKTFNYLK